MNAIGVSVIDADDDRGTHAARADGIIGRFAQTPCLSGEGAEVVEEILSVLHVENGIASIGAIVVARRRVDGELAFVAEKLRLEIANDVDASAPNGGTPIEHTRKRAAESAAQIRHRYVMLR